MEESFGKRWSDKEAAIGVPSELRADMVSFGGLLLPCEAAPFLSFDKALGKKRIFEVYGSSWEWSDKDKERLSPYIMIGSDGSGNPICQRNTDEAVVLIDHEDGFNSISFVNSGVQQLQESLLAYFGERDAVRFLSEMQKIDPKAIEPESFWSIEAKAIGE